MTRLDEVNDEYDTFVNGLNNCVGLSCNDCKAIFPSPDCPIVRIRTVICKGVHNKKSFKNDQECVDYLIWLHYTVSLYEADYCLDCNCGQCKWTDGNMSNCKRRKIRALFNIVERAPYEL
jgi:hypothetical protein